MTNLKQLFLVAHVVILNILKDKNYVNMNELEVKRTESKNNFTYHILSKIENNPIRTINSNLNNYFDKLKILSNGNFQLHFCIESDNNILAKFTYENKIYDLVIVYMNTFTITIKYGN